MECIPADSLIIWYLTWTRDILNYDIAQQYIPIVHLHIQAAASGPEGTAGVCVLQSI